MVSVRRDLLEVRQSLENESMGVRVEIHGLIASVDVAVTPCINKRNHRLSMLWGDVEALCPRRELLELHDVTSKRASLIREDVLDLTELFVDIGALSAHGKVLIAIIHVNVLIHEVSLKELDHFKGHQQ